MRTNFDFLKKEKLFDSFSDVAINAEKSYSLSPDLCVTQCRRAMEFAVRWMYSYDSDLIMPYDDKLSSLLTTQEFREIVDPKIQMNLQFIRKAGNKTTHSATNISDDVARTCLEELWDFMDWVDYAYAKEYTDGQKYDTAILDEIKAGPKVEKPNDNEPSIDIQKLIQENEALRKELAEHRAQASADYKPKNTDQRPDTEVSTRRAYIDTMLRDAGWQLGKDWFNEYEVDHMPNDSGKGYCDYLLADDTGMPLAVIEAKKTSEDVAKGRYQAELYAQSLKLRFGRKPVIFLTNGFEWRINDGQYPERKVAAVYSKRDLQKLFNLRTAKAPLDHIQVSNEIAGRYYQKEAIQAVCSSLDKDNRRKALLVMATGTGKTRTVVGLVDVLLHHGWVKNVLFLADRTELVRQAKKPFTNFLPNLTSCNLVTDKDPDYDAHIIFSTYQTMMNLVDDAKDDEGRVFTAGHFDLVIVDEAHRSIYNKYQDIFNYFDAPLIGLTATPKDEIDKNTYSVFQLQNGVPTYEYPYSKAIEEGYLVPYVTIDSPLKFVNNGIKYDELSAEEKEEYEATFADEDGVIPDEIDSSAINSYVFNEDTIVKMIDLLWRKGLRIDGGETLGKTIIFARNHNHAEAILKVFNQQHPEVPDYAAIIDNHVKFASNLIDKFKDPKQRPQIAISVDMMDTGIDVPEVLNLVFFKPVYSKAKFWQMIGRGTRTCRELLDGEDKKEFYIFDLCSNFTFFNEHPNGKAEDGILIPLQGALYVAKARLCSKLQDMTTSTEETQKLRKRLVSEMVEKVKELNRDNFAVRQHLKYVEQYSVEDAYRSIAYEDTLIMATEIAPLLNPDAGDPKAYAFDYLMYSLEYLMLENPKSANHCKGQIRKQVEGLSKIAGIDQITAQKPLIMKILHESYLDHASTMELEEVRLALRDLIKYITHDRPIYITRTLDDEFLSINERPTDIPENETDYASAAEHYIKTHAGDIPAVQKLYNNEALNEKDMQELEKVLWKDLGSKEQYEARYGKEPLGEFVRSVVGMNKDTVRNAFSKYLDENTMNANQIYFVNQIVEYLTQNGTMKDFRVLTDAPFTNAGGLSEVFTDLSQWQGIQNIIKDINQKAEIS